MATVNLSTITGGSQDDLAEQVALMRKDLEDILENLDHLNVKRLYTEYCDIRSAAGETVIDGPTLLMYDKQATPRLRLEMGYKPGSSDFVFNMYNKAGVKTIGIDSNGDGTFTGTITGGTIQTAVALNSRIVITGNTLKTYYSNGVTESLMGPAWGIGASEHYGDLSFYDTGVETFRIENALVGGGWTLRPMNGGGLVVGYGGANTYASGAWSFSTADSITGLATSAASGHTHTVIVAGTVYETSSAGGHSHTVVKG